MGCSASRELDMRTPVLEDSRKPAPSLENSGGVSSVKPAYQDQPAPASAEESSTSGRIKAGLGKAGDGFEGRERRGGVDGRLIKEQIKKQLLPPDSDEGVVSDSEDEHADVEDVSSQDDAQDDVPDKQVFHDIMEALQGSFVFKGIRTAVLNQLIKRMKKVQYAPSDVIVQQGAQASPSDCMYYIVEGEVDIVISGGSGATHKDDDIVESKGAQTVVRKGAGWTFGVLTLLFRAPRSASVVAHTGVTVMAMDRRTFISFVMTHAKGARATCFLRKLPLLQGLADDRLMEIASRVKQEVYEAGEHLIHAGDHADALYIIRYGTVVVKIGEKELATLGRGKFVGERTLVTGKLRSASCVAQTRVTAIVMKKKEFLDVSNPMLDWMIPYDAARAVLTHQPVIKELTSDQFESLLDNFDPKQEAVQNTQLIPAGSPINKLWVFITGAVELRDADGQAVSSPPRDGLLQEDGGFSSFGMCCLSDCKVTPYSLHVTSPTLTYVVLEREKVDEFLGVRANQDTQMSENAKLFALGVLQQSHILSKLPPEQLEQLVGQMTSHQCAAGHVIVHMKSPANDVVLLQHGECIAAKAVVSENTTLQDLQAVGHTFMVRGDFYGEVMLIKRLPNPASIVAVRNGTVTLVLSIQAIMKVLKLENEVAVTDFLLTVAAGGDDCRPGKSAAASVNFGDLRFHRVVGRGQFGSVRLVTLKKTGEAMALKTMYKQPISDGKQVEHIINELTVMKACAHPFCVQLRGSFQDQNCLYMLMEWVPGGELFHYIDMYHSFDELTARFYAANVVLMMEFLHSKGIIYRDLKPENLVVDANGYLKLADFGFAKHIGNARAFTICGTPDYQAPEVIMRRGATKGVDHWAIGVLIFEMLVGEPPFMSATNDPWDTFRRAATGRCHVPSFVSEDATDLIYRLLQVNPDRRLGAHGVAEIKQHPWFNGISWNDLEAKRVKPPMVPKLKNPTDTSNFGKYDDSETPPPNNRKDRNLWQMWEWVETSSKHHERA